MPKICNRHPIEASLLFAIWSKKRLAKVLGFKSLHFLKLTKALARGDQLYREWDDTSKRKVRHIENPCYHLKVVQKRINDLLMQIKPPDYLYCPVRGRDQIKNVLVHRHAREVRSLDIKDFHPSVPSRRVFWFFRERMRCVDNVAGILTAIVTYNGHIPTGGSASSIIAFFAYIDMWEEIDSIAHDAGCTMTVYGDDITLSGYKVPERIMWAVKQAIRKRGLRYHKETHHAGETKVVNKLIVKDGRLARPNRQLLKEHETRIALQADCPKDERAILIRRLRGCEARGRLVAAANNQPHLGVTPG
jgi:retron-type reverse transcriptase